VQPADFDVVVVGGGAAGGVVARRLSERGDIRVLLIEAGPDLGDDVIPALRNGWNNPTGSEWLHDWGFAAEPDEIGTAPKLRRGRLLGGTSWLTRFAVRGAAADFEAWAARGNPGWGYEDVLPSFCRLEADREFGDRPGHGDGGPIEINRFPTLARSEIHAAALEAFAGAGFPSVEDHNAADVVGAGPMPMSTRSGHRITTLDAYLPPGSRPSHVTIRTDAQVASVDARQGRAIGVTLLDGSRVAAGWVVLCAGTYSSPPILLRSGIGPARELQELGIEVVVDLEGVGANLADHPAVDLDSGWRGDGRDAPILHSIATFRSATQAPTAAPDLMFWVTDPAAADPGFYFDPILLKPEARGSVRLRTADPRDAPRITLPVLRAGRDIDRLAEGYRLGVELANHGAIRALAADAPASSPRTETDLRQRITEAAYSLPHVVGTCRMGPRPEDGDVVDALGRVHGIERLSVVDASIIPDAPSGFPHLITIMLAEHLSVALSDLVAGRDPEWENRPNTPDCPPGTVSP
jgi:choline dehydrogenase